MTDDTDVREFLHQMADEVPLSPVDPRPAVRRAKRRLVRTLSVATLVLAALVAGSAVGIGRLTAAPPSVPAHPGPTGGVVVFGRGAEKDHFQLFTIAADGTNERELLAHPSLSQPPSLSPDGTIVVSVGPSPRDAKTDAAIIVDVKTGKVRVLEMPDPTLFPVCLIWSSDGNRLACGLQGHGRSGIYTIRSSDGSGLTRVTSIPGGEDDPLVFSPDGSKLLFLRAPHGSTEYPNQLFVVDSDGGLARRLNPPGSTADIPFLGSELGSGSWSPDGRQVTFAAASRSSSASDQRTAVFVVNADGSDRHRITPWASAFLAQWSPDGRWIAYSGRQPGEQGGTEIFVVHPDGTGLREITSSPGGFSFGAVWSPDSTKLLFVRGGDFDRTDLWTVKVEGAELRQLTHTPGRYVGYGWALG